MIKKILFGFALLASVTACTEDYTDWGEPQKNAQEGLLSFGDGSVAPVGVIDFAEIAEGQELVQVCSITAPSASDSEYAPEYLLTIGNTDFEINAAGQVSVAALQDYVNNTFGRRPTEREMDATVSMWLNNGTTSVKQASAALKITAKPDGPQISEMYYLIIGDIEGTSWNVADVSMPFSHSGKDVYDDPAFTVTFPVEDGEYWFAFTDDISIAAYEATGDWSQVFGCAEGNGNNGMEGKVARRAEIDDDGSFVVTVAGDAKFIRLTLNMMDYSYTIEKVNFGPYIYEIGNESGWATSNPLYCGDGNGGYQGYYYLNGEFKFKPNLDDWDGDYECSGEGTLTQDGSDNCPDPGAGFYQIDVDLAKMTYSLTEVISITCVGNHNGWKEADASQHMTYNTELGCWEITTELTNGFKFAMNDGWAVSWGGANDDPAAYDNLTQNGGKDLNVPEGDGTYLVQLYISYEGNNRVEFTKQ